LVDASSVCSCAHVWRVYVTLYEGDFLGDFFRVLG